MRVNSIFWTPKSRIFHSMPNLLSSSVTRISLKIYSRVIKNTINLNRIVRKYHFTTLVIDRTFNIRTELKFYDIYENILPEGGRTSLACSSTKNKERERNNEPQEPDTEKERERDKETEGRGKWLKHVGIEYVRRTSGHAGFATVIVLPTVLHGQVAE